MAAGAGGGSLDPAGGLDDPHVVALLQRHLDDMTRHSPPGRIHALDLSRLRAPGLAFWAAWRGDALAGCGAPRVSGDGHRELTALRTGPAHLRQGVAAAMLAHLIATALAQGLRRLSVDTGSAAAFAPAHALYARHGFATCGPFGDDVGNSSSVIMIRAL